MSSPTEPDVAAVLRAQLERWPTRVAGLALVTDAGTVAVGSDAVLPWASVSKLVTALATLRDVADGLISLDDPAGPPGSTLAHVLAHASGLAMEAGGAAREPGTRRVYSNAGYDLLGELGAQRSGRSAAAWLHDRVLAPLGMSSTRLEGSAAHGVHGPVRDLALLGAELWRPTLLPAPLAERMRTPAWPDLIGVVPGFGLQRPCPWGLGPEVRGHKQPHWTGAANTPATFGHFGQSGSFLWVDPEADVVLVSLCDRPFGEWAAQVWPSAADAVLQLV
ncbi:serine hydrolase domain-containing protein [Angustibacter aerolatus]